MTSALPIALIAAYDRGRVIGRDGAMPWHLPEDLRFFRQTTRGKPIIMGRLTFESIGRPLPERYNIVVSRSAQWTAEGCQVCRDLDEAMACARKKVAEGWGDEVMIVGGGQLYRATLPLANRVYLTLIDADIGGDTFFPALDANRWQCCWQRRHPPDERHPYPLTFTRWQRLDAL